MGDYFAHWLNIGKTDGIKLPKVFYVNWFRKDADGHFVWPGYGENSRVLKWIVERIEGTADAVDTPIGKVPSVAALDTEGLSVSETELAEALRVDTAEWSAEVPQIVEWFEKFGEKLPGVLWSELDALKARLGML